MKLLEMKYITYKAQNLLAFDEEPINNIKETL